MKLLVTGGCGFIGSHFIHTAIEKDPNVEIINLDKLTYAGRLENVRDLEGNARYKFVKGDILDRELVKGLAKETDEIVHFAAETHVDRSIMAAGEFAMTDVLGTQSLLEAALDAGHERFFHISTDEVYGSRVEGFFKEEDAMLPNSPYSASKAGAEMMVRAYEKTYGLKATVTRSSNNYGPNQHPEKFIPMAITNIIRGKKVPIYGDGKNVRDWLYVKDNCEAIHMLLTGKHTGVYNLGAMGGEENIKIARDILGIMDKKEECLQHVEDRKGHDWRYAINTSKITGLGWKPKMKLDDGLKITVEWYMANKKWWAPLVDDYGN
ncbi:MAG: dTDP-glucose 4,6-dehydratase [Candidatus Micrarchaeia archaeon]